MPNRIIKESICYSDDIDQLTAFEETVFTRLLVRVDDFGRLDARPSFLKNTLFVTKKGVTEKNVEDALIKLASLGLVRVYEVDQKPFLVLPTWEKHQTIRAKKSKYPAPLANNDNLQASEIICKQMQTNASKCSRNPIQSNQIQSESNPNPYCTERSDDHSMPEANSEFVVEQIPLNDLTLFDITQTMFDEWVKLYPAVDVRQQLRSMIGWCNANPTRKKTKTGIKKFINGWLAREQDKGRKPAVQGKDNSLNKDYSTPEDAKRSEMVKRFMERRGAEA